MSSEALRPEMADHSDFTLTEALSQLAMKASGRQLAAIKR